MESGWRGERKKEREREVVLRVFKQADRDSELTRQNPASKCQQESSYVSSHHTWLLQLWPHSTVTHTLTYTYTGLSRSITEDLSRELASSGSSCLLLNEGRHSLVSQGAGCLPVPRPLSAILLRTKWSPYERRPALSLHRSHLAELRYKQTPP